MIDNNASEFSTVEIEKLRRMLAAFEASLPSHEIGNWKIERQPDALTLENTDPERTRRSTSTGVGWRIIGECECLRCGKRFEIPRIGNFHWGFEWKQEREDMLIMSARRWVTLSAERDGPCWGDVPRKETE